MSVTIFPNEIIQKIFEYLDRWNSLKNNILIGNNDQKYIRITPFSLKIGTLLSVNLV